MNNRRPPLRSNKIFGATILSLVIASSLPGISCGGASPGEKANGNSNAADRAAAGKVDDVQDNLGSVRRAGFPFIFVLKRPDGGVWTAEDKEYFRNNSPAEANQRRLTQDGKALIIGSNYKFMPEHLDALRKRFTVEDYSRPLEETTTGAGANANRQNSNAAR